MGGTRPRDSLVQQPFGALLLATANGLPVVFQCEELSVIGEWQSGVELCMIGLFIKLIMLSR